MSSNRSSSLGRYRFSAGIALSLFTILAVVLCAILATWQWQRAASANERYLKQQANSQHILSRLPVDPAEYQRVQITGDVIKYYFLDNRSNEHRAGRELLVEIGINSETLPFDKVLVNIGWQPRIAGLQPAYLLPKMLAVDGIVKFPNQGIQLQDPLLDPNWPSLMQHVDLSLMNRAQSTRYYPAVIYSITPVEEWALPVVIIKNKYQMHLGYTIQWALLGLVFVILFIKVGTTREQNESEQKMAT